jgi:hypothetical protein
MASGQANKRPNCRIAGLIAGAIVGIVVCFAFSFVTPDIERVRVPTGNVSPGIFPGTFRETHTVREVNRGYDSDDFVMVCLFAVQGGFLGFFAGGLVADEVYG